MIFFIFFFLLAAGMPSVVVFLAVYLQAYSDATLSGIGALLMVLPFVGLVTKTFVCALADRSQAHKFYLILTVLISMLGYGLLIVAPFFPDLYTKHGLISWWLAVIGIIVGGGSVSAVNALGDALSASAARRRKIAWGLYRAFATFAWGLGGFTIGYINEVPFLPKYTPGIILLVVTLALNAILLAVWPNKAFDMLGEDDQKQAGDVEHKSFDHNDSSNSKYPNKGSIRGSLNTVTVANVILQDLGGSMSPSIRRQRKKRPSVGQVFPQEAVSADRDSTAVAIADSNNRLESAADEPGKKKKDLQIELLKLLVKRDPRVVKYVIFFTLFGILLFTHIVYLFLQVEELCREKGYVFSTLVGWMLAIQSACEIFGFVVLGRFYMPWVGKNGSMMSIGVVFALRYLFYGTYFSQLSPYWSLPAETAHGFAFSVGYSLVTEVANECVDFVDKLMPELIETKLVEPGVNGNELKANLRATMQGLFSGAFDGLGCGLGGLIGGIYLDINPGGYKSLWLWLCGLSVLLCMYNGLCELQRINGSGNGRHLEADLKSSK